MFARFSLDNYTIHVNLRIGDRHLPVAGRCLSLLNIFAVLLIGLVKLEIEACGQVG
jgi:hypothetical protein